MHLTIPELLQLFIDRGTLPYGSEAVSQLDHALQCAALATTAHQPAEMVAACLLHDLGHLVHHLGVRAADQGIDDCHEYRAIPYLTAQFSAAVWQPIRLHVQAKRYLCATDPQYWQALSEGSKETLVLQGGPFSEAEATAFMAQPYAAAAVQLRRWDDLAKVPNLPTPSLRDFIPVLEACARAPA